MKLTVLFDESCKYWIGVIEQEENERKYQLRVQKAKKKHRGK
ncbi:hypothetical protein [Paenibacillus lautus]